MSKWVNSDGLLVKSGPDEATPAKAGAYVLESTNEHTIEAIINWNKFEAYGTDTILSDTLVIPDGARITSVKVYVDTAFTSGGSATLIVGLKRTDRSTAYDADGLVASTAVASLTSGATITGSGALVNTTLAYDALLTATVGTADFTAGKAKIVVTYYNATSGTHS